jgi:Glyoxalase-like domain
LSAIHGPGTLDHIGLFVPDMARAGQAMERIGFALTPLTPQRHAMGSGELAPAGTANRLAVLQQGYIEILTATGDTPIADQLRRAIGRYTGAHLIAFGSADAEETHARLDRAGFDPLPIVRLECGGPGTAGDRLARFSVVRVPPERMIEGRMQFCRHYTPELVWQPERQDHPNRAQGLTDILLCAPDPAEAAARYGRFLDLAPEPRDGFWLIRLARGRLHVLDRMSLLRLTGIEAPTMPFIAGFALTSTDLAATRAVLAEGAIATRELVPV